LLGGVRRRILREREWKKERGKARESESVGKMVRERAAERESGREGEGESKCMVCVCVCVCACVSVKQSHLSV